MELSGPSLISIVSLELHVGAVQATGPRIRARMDQCFSETLANNIITQDIGHEVAL